MNQTEPILHKDLSYQINGLAMEVKYPVTVYFQGHPVGNYFADIMVEDRIILELKATEKIGNAHRAQALNDLKATGLDLAVILNFGKERLEFERLVN